MRYFRVNFCLCCFALLYGCPEQAAPVNPYQNPYATDNREANPPPGQTVQAVPSIPETPVAPAQTTPAPAVVPVQTTPMTPKVATPAPMKRSEKEAIRVRMELVPAGPVTKIATVKATSQAVRDSSVKWNIKPDQLQSDLWFDKTATAGIAIPSGVEGDLRVLYPTSGGPIVAVGVNEGTSIREVYDLREKTKVGEVTGLTLGGSPFQAISADGKFFAAHPAQSSVVGVFDVMAGKPYNVINTGISPLQYVGFAGTDKLLFVTGNVLHVMDVVAWKETSKASIPYPPRHGHWGTSAGGNYVLFTNEDQGATYANLLNIKGGGLEGRLKIGTAVQRFGCSFSQDGGSLALLFTQGPVTNLQVWDMASGSIKTEAKILEPIADLLESPSCNISWFPDQSKLLLFGRAIFDLNESKLAKVIPHESNEPAIAVAGNQVAVVESEQLNLLQIDGKASGTETSTSAATMQAALTSGDSFDDSALPPLSAPDRADTKAVPLNVNSNSWDYIPRQAKLLSKNVVSKPVSIPAGQIYKANISNGDWPYAAVLYSNQPLSPTRSIRPQSEEPDNRVWIEWFEMRSGTKKQPFDLPFSTTLEDINQEGDMIVTRIENGMDRLDFWTLKTGKHEYGFRPYHSVQNPTGAAVDFVQFVDDDKHLLTQGGGMLTLWEIPACKAIWEVPVGQLLPMVAPGLKSVVVSSLDEQKVCFIDIAKGETTGVLNSGATKGQPVTAVAISPDAQNIMLFTQRGDGSRVVVQDLKLNKELHNFALPIPATAAVWVDANYVLIDGKSLLKLDDYAIGWNYHLPAGMSILDSPDGKYWYLSAEQGEFAMVSVVLPDQAALKTLKSKTVVSEILLSPGAKVSVSNHVDSLHAHLMKPLEEHLTRSLQENGYHITSGQTTEISIQAIQEPTGRDLEGKLIGELPGNLKPPTVKIDEEILTLQVILSEKGTPLWQQAFQVENAGEFEFVLDTLPKEVIAIAVSSRGEAMWDTILQDSLKINLPEIIFAEGAERGLGESTLSTKGIR